MSTQQIGRYPVFLSLDDVRVLIIGFGEVGRRKLEKLLPCRPARVLILEPGDPGDEGRALLDEAARLGVDVEVRPEAFTEALLDGFDMVFACAGDHDLNRRAALACRARRKLCNCVDDPPLGSFHVPAVARGGGMCAALSTGGASPALARRWRLQLEDWVTPRARMAEMLGRLRPMVLALGLDSDENRVIFRAASAHDVEDAMVTGDMARVRALLEERLPEALRGSLEVLLHDLNPLP